MLSRRWRPMAFLALTVTGLPVAFLVAVVAFCGAGCENWEQVTTYRGSVTVSKTNGKVIAVEVSLLGQNGVVVRNRNDAMALIAQLESTLADLRIASDQFAADEHKEEATKGVR